MTTAQTEPKVWLITGASQGLGLSLTLAALRKGHKVIATARQPNKARSEHPDVESNGGIWIELDVSQPDTQARVDAAIREHGGGKIDVVMNNAGFFSFQPAEDMLDEEMLLSLNTHIMGPFRVIKAALPYMRAQNSGTLVLNSSCLGMRPCPGNVAYSAVKAAGDMIYEVLRLELKTFNIRTLILNSGLMFSGITANAHKAKATLGPHYFGEGTTLGGMLPYYGMAENDPYSLSRGDPAKWTERVLELIDKSGKYGSALADATRVLLGPDSIELADQQIERLKKEVDDSREIAATTDFEGTTAPGMAFLIKGAP